MLNHMSNQDISWLHECHVESYSRFAHCLFLGEGSTMSSMRGTLTRSVTRHKAPHKPKTYVEQLQELNAPHKLMRSGKFSSTQTSYQYC